MDLIPTEGRKSRLASFATLHDLGIMSVEQLQVELSKLTSQEKLALIDYLARQTEEALEPSCAQLAEPALGVDWNRSEEDAAWQHLQKGR